MEIRVGLVGLPNVGKSTIFNALTKNKIVVANYPFSTINPNYGIVRVADQRINVLATILQSKKIVHGQMTFIDIAGLIKGASKGEGLGNQFLNKIRETEVIAHVVRCFNNNDVIHFSGAINPEEDINIVNMELSLADLDICKSVLNRIIHKKNIKGTAELEIQLLKRCNQQLEQFGHLRELSFSTEERLIIDNLNFLTIKPMMFIANYNIDDKDHHLFLDQVKLIAKKKNISFSKFFRKMTNNKLFFRSKKLCKLNDSSINNIISSAYKLLNLQSYFTVTSKEIRAWLNPIGTTAYNASGKIHSDFKKGFIRAQIISYKDFINYNGEKGSKMAGKIRYEGKDYIINDGDIIKFLFKV
ncbi:MAG: redox-regulated ATPase YchF [Candidatus Dasytiphilus stammeri]